MSKTSYMDMETYLDHEQLKDVVERALIEKGLIPNNTHGFNLEIFTPNGSIDPKKFSVKMSFRKKLVI